MQRTMSTANPLVREMFLESITTDELASLSYEHILSLLEYSIIEFNTSCDLLSMALSQPPSASDDNQALEFPSEASSNNDNGKRPLPSPAEDPPALVLDQDNNKKPKHELPLPEEDPIEVEKLPVYPHHVADERTEPDVMYVNVPFPYKRTYCGTELVYKENYQVLECDEQMRAPMSPPPSSIVQRSASLSPSTGRTMSISDARTLAVANARGAFSESNGRTMSTFATPASAGRTMSAFVTPASNGRTMSAFATPASNGRTMTISPPTVERTLSFIPDEQKPSVDVPVVQALLDTPVVQALLDASVGQAPTDAPVMQAPIDTPVVQALLDAPVEQATPGVPVEQAPTDAPVEQAVRNLYDSLSDVSSNDGIGRTMS